MSCVQCPFAPAKRCSGDDYGLCSYHWDVVFGIRIRTYPVHTERGPSSLRFMTKRDTSTTLVPFPIAPTNEAIEHVTQHPDQAFNGAPTRLVNLEEATRIVNHVYNDMKQRQVNENEAKQIRLMLFGVLTDNEIQAEDTCGIRCDRFMDYSNLQKEIYKRRLRNTSINLVITAPNGGRGIFNVAADTLPVFCQLMLFYMEVSSLVQVQVDEPDVVQLLTVNTMYDSTTSMLVIDKASCGAFYFDKIEENLPTALVISGTRRSEGDPTTQLRFENFDIAQGIRITNRNAVA